MTYYPPLWFEERLAECRRIAPVLDSVGALVWDCVVPAEWCPPGNKRDSLNWQDVHKMKENLRTVMRNKWLHDAYSLDAVGPASVPLPSRPVVTCYRYTPHRVDPRSNWDKFPVDLLTPYREVPIKGKRPRRSGLLGLIRDDSGDHIDLRAEWVKSKLGCVYVRVFAGHAGAALRGPGTNMNQLTKSAVRTISAQLAARREELKTCSTPAQLSCVLREVERLQAILTRGAWV